MQIGLWVTLASTLLARMQTTMRPSNTITADLLGKMKEFLDTTVLTSLILSLMLVHLGFPIMENQQLLIFLNHIEAHYIANSGTSHYCNPRILQIE